MKLDIILQNITEDTSFKDFYVELSKVKKYDKCREVYLRPSMLPVCSMTLYLQLLAYKYNVQRCMDFFGLYFTSVGTTVHENAQALHSYASKVGHKVWGNWHCPTCNKSWKYSTRSTCLCGCKAIYDEIELEAYGFKGHIDCILITPRGVVVCDYKTTTRRNTQKDFENLNVAYSLQILTYCLMLEKVWGDHFKQMGYGKVYAGTLLFICRDNPSQVKHVTFRFNSKIKKQVLSMTKQAVKQLKSAKKSFKTGKIDFVMATKSCKSRLDYYNNRQAFHKYEDCPMFDVCWNKKTARDYISDIIPCKIL